MLYTQRDEVEYLCRCHCFATTLDHIAVAHQSGGSLPKQPAAALSLKIAPVSRGMVESARAWLHDIFNVAVTAEAAVTAPEVQVHLLAAANAIPMSGEVTQDSCVHLVLKPQVRHWHMCVHVTLAPERSSLARLRMEESWEAS